MNARDVVSVRAIGKEHCEYKTLKIAYVTHYDPRDVKTWSGTGFVMAQCLRDQGFDLDLIGPLRNQYAPLNVGTHLLNRFVLRQQDHPQRDPKFLQYLARQVEERIRRSDAQVVFAAGGLAMSYLQTNLPTAMWTDCTFANLVDYYPKFSNLSARTLKAGHDGERRALHGSDILFFSSEWAAESAIRDYGVPENRVHVVSFGSNLGIEIDEQLIEEFISDRLASLQNGVRLFCAGVDWHRKGIDFALKVADHLNARGQFTELVVAGCEPPDRKALPSYVHLLGFLSKASDEGRRRLISEFSKAHFLIQPSRAECYGIVFCEAASLGLPSLSFRTGGVASVITNGVNGHLFQLSETPEAWAAHILGLVNNTDKYKAICRAAFSEYVKRLNWKASGEIIKGHLEGLARSPKRPRSAR